MATQVFRSYGHCIFEGKKGKPKQAKGSHEDVSGGKHVVRARSWWKRGEDWVLTLEPGGDTVREGLPWNQAKFLSKMDVLFVKILIQRDL